MLQKRFALVGQVSSTLLIVALNMQKQLVNDVP